MKRNVPSIQSCGSIFGKIGRLASEEVTLHLLKIKYIPILLYGFEVPPLNKSQISSTHFVKLFNTNIIETV